jgi:hypothetical protein
VLPYNNNNKERKSISVTKRKNNRKSHFTQ